jgi:hypothetical protein
MIAGQAIRDIDEKAASTDRLPSPCIAEFPLLRGLKNASSRREYRAW